MTQSPWVVTDAGLITAAGDTAQELFAAVIRGVPMAATGTAEPFTAPIPGFDPKNYMKRKGLKDLSRTSQLACAAAARVAEGLAGIPASSVGVTFGTAWGSLDTVIAFERAAQMDGPRFVDPMLFTETVSNVPAGQIAIVHGWSAFNVTLSAGTASGIEALRQAIELLTEGRAQVAVAGGADQLSVPILRALATRPGGSLSRSSPAASMTSKESPPTDSSSHSSSFASSIRLARSYQDLVGGEGACLLVLEDEHRARARGALPLARVSACAVQFDRVSSGEERSGGEPSHARAIEAFLGATLDRAQLEPHDMDLLVLSAPKRLLEELAGTVDQSSSALSDCLRKVRTMFPAAVLGETWGASGPIGVVVAIEAMRTAALPSPGHLGAPVSCKVRHALVVDLAVTGHMAAIIVSTIHEGGNDGP